MSSFKQMIKIKDKVRFLMVKNKATRDSDECLEVAFRKEELKGKLSNMTASEYLKHLAKGKMVSFESISRCRRKIQEQEPSLRGTRYKERHNEEKQMRKKVSGL